MIDLETLDKNSLWKWALTFAFSLSIMLIPTNEVFTPSLRLFFAVTSFVIFLFIFEFAPLLVSAALLPALYIFSGLAPIDVVLSPWLKPVVYMAIGAFIFANVLDECGLLRRICLWCIVKCGGTYNKTLYAFYLAGVILSIITFGRGYIIIATMAYGICKAFGYDKPCKESAIIMSVACIGAFGCTAFIYSPVTISLLQSGIEAVGLTVTMNWYTAFVYNWPHIISALLFIWVMTKIFKTKNFIVANGQEYFKEELNALGKISKEEIHSLIILAVIVGYILTQSLHGWSLEYIFFLAPYLLFFPGLRAATVQSANKVSLNVLIFMTSCMGIGTVGVSVGFRDFFMATAIPIVSSLGAVPVCILTVIIAAASNLVLSASAIYATLSAPLAQIADMLGMNPVTLMMATIVGSDCYFFPHEVTTFVVVFSFGLITMKDFIKLASLKTLLTFAIFCLIEIPYWYLAGLFYV